MDALPFLASDPILNPLRIGPHTFPGVWNYSMPAELRGLKFPAERRSTCMSCPKANHEGYRQDYRCCTYHPRIPNYLIGLSTYSAQGLAAFEAVVAEGMLLPEGMNHAPKQWYDYLDDTKNERFGASDKVLCPMLDRSNGFCRVHAFRNSVCSTFFCHKDHGKAGENFWNDVQTLGSQVEMALSQWALQQVGFDLQRYFRSFETMSRDIARVSGSSGWSQEALDELWGDWKDRKLELMQACAQVIADNRENLWEIANSCEIHESPAFNTAMVKAVPRNLKDEVDPEDLEDDDGEAETARPSDLWKLCMKTYERLWDLPEGDFELNPKAEIVANSLEDEESRFYEDRPYSLRVYSRKGSRKLDWRMFISQEEKEALTIFNRQGRSMDWRLLLDPRIKALPNGKGFLAEMLRSKVLVREPLH